MRLPGETNDYARNDQVLLTPRTISFAGNSIIRAIFARLELCWGMHQRSFPASWRLQLYPPSSETYDDTISPMHPLTSRVFGDPVRSEVLDVDAFKEIECPIMSHVSGGSQ